MKVNPFSLLGLALVLAQCKKGDPGPAPPTDPVATLPAETQTGAGTFGCLVNGKPFCAPNSLYAHGDWTSLTRVSISSTCYENCGYTGNAATVIMVLNGDLGSMKPDRFNLVPLGVATPGLNQFFVGVSDPTNFFYSGQYIKTGQVTLTKFDGAARIAAGRFAFTLYEPGKPDTLKVTNGRFDVKF